MFPFNNQLQTIQGSSRPPIVKYTNMGAYLGFIIITYNYIGGSGQIEGPFVPVLQSYTAQLPAGITALFINVYDAVYYGTYNLFQSFTILNPKDDICITSYGSLFYAWAEQHPCTSSLDSSVSPLALPISSSFSPTCNCVTNKSIINPCNKVSNSQNNYLCFK